MDRASRSIAAVVLAVGLLRAVAAGAVPQPVPAIAVDPLPLRALLVSRDFAELEERFAAARSAPDAYELLLIVGSFANLTPEQEAGLDAWVAERPESVPAHLALARRELDRAWEARGVGFASTLDADMSDRMRAHAARAVSLAEAVIGWDPGWMDAYRIQIACAQLLGDGALAQRAFTAALGVDPTHFGVWDNYSSLFQRRWGGSYEAQEEIARAAQAYAEANPRLRLLLGDADRDRARDLWTEGRRSEAVAVLGRALAHGDNPLVLHERSQLHSDLRDWPAAEADLERALALDPYLAKLHSHRAYMCAWQHDFACMLEGSARAVELDPTDESYRGQHAWATWAVANPAEAARQLERNPVQSWLYWNGSWIYRHALEGAAIATVIGLAVYAARARRRRLRDANAAAAPITRFPETASPFGAPPARPSMVERLPRTGVLMVRAFVWFQVVTHVLVYSELVEDGATAWLDIAITVPALAGALGFAHGVRLGAAWLWKLWTVVYPAWNTFLWIQVEGITWDQWPLFVFAHVKLLPLYAALFAYGYACTALWAGGRPGPGWGAPRVPVTPLSDSASGSRASDPLAIR